MNTLNTLNTPLQIGPYQLEHRVVLAPMTRLRSDQPSDAASEMMARFYGQRASAGGLQIAEAAAISLTGRSYLGAPGIYTQAHVAGWKKTTDAVHAKGGIIFLQVFHGGRQSHVEMTGGVAPLAPSVVPFEGVAMTADGFVPASAHREMTLEDIAQVVADFRRAAQLALDAGFDGV